MRQYEQLQEAPEAVDHFVAELQAGIDHADTYNSHFAHDLLWGSPLRRDRRRSRHLRAIHQRLLSQPVAGPSSRYEVVNVTAPSPTSP